jgi:predicted nucleotidyltransferase
LVFYANIFEQTFYNNGKSMSKDVTKYEFITELKKLPFIEEIWLFGSRAREDHKERADIDLAIICPNATDSDWLKVMDIIEEADTLLKIDCIRFGRERISNELYANILNDRKVI